MEMRFRGLKAKQRRCCALRRRSDEEARKEQTHSRAYLAPAARGVPSLPRPIWAQRPVRPPICRTRLDASTNGLAERRNTLKNRNAQQHAGVTHETGVNLTPKKATKS